MCPMAATLGYSLTHFLLTDSNAFVFACHNRRLQLLVIEVYASSSSWKIVSPPCVGAHLTSMFDALFFCAPAPKCFLRRATPTPVVQQFAQRTSLCTALLCVWRVVSLSEQTALAAVGCMTTWSEIYKGLSAADAQASFFSWKICYCGAGELGKVIGVFPAIRTTIQKNVCRDMHTAVC